MLGRFHHYPALSHMYCCRLVRMAILTGWIWFLVVILIGISPVILEMQSILSCGSVGFFILEENWPCAIGFLKVGCVCNLFLQYSLQDLSWGWACLCAKLLQLRPTLCDPMNHSPPDYPAHGILQARILEWVAMPSSKGSSWPRDWTSIFMSPALAGSSLPLEPPVKPQ